MLSQKIFSQTKKDCDNFLLEDSKIINNNNKVTLLFCANKASLNGIEGKLSYKGRSPTILKICCGIDTFSSIFGNNSEGGWSVHCAVTQTRAVRCHMTTVNGINVELEWTSCSRENKRGIL